MWFHRTVLDDLRLWAGKKPGSRKPLILRGTRQVGKTVVGKMFGKSFDTFFYLNLDKKKSDVFFSVISVSGTLFRPCCWLKRRLQTTRRPSLAFWVRQKSQSRAEVDFVIQHRDMIVPVEVKAGAVGRLRSLHQFIDRCPHALAVRLYAGPLEVTRARTPGGKEFTLLSLPYFLSAYLSRYLDWLENTEGMARA